MLTIASLHKRVKFLADSTPLKFQPLKGCYGRTDFDKGAPTIILSRVCYNTGDHLSKEAIVSTYLHELVHVAFPRELSTWGTFEEAIVCVLEKALYEFVCAKPSRLKWWVKRIGD